MQHAAKIFLVVAAILAVTVTGARAGLLDDTFDSYPTGGSLHGLGGWKGWDNDPTWTAPTSGAEFVSAPNSAEIGGTADLVNQYNLAGGQITYSVQQLIPDGGVGQNYFILMNQYNDGGPYDWSVQMNCDMDAGLIVSDFGDGASLPIKWGEWTELRFEIDLNANTVDEFYGGDLLSSHVWDDTGNNTFQAVDLYANGASSIFYDNVPEPTTWAMLLGLGFCGLIAWLRRRR